MAKTNISELEKIVLILTLIIAFLTLFFGAFGPLPPQWSPYGPEISIKFAVMPKLLNIESINAIDELGLSYNGEPVNQPYLLKYKIQNSGREPISKIDYSKHITLDFGSSHQILNVSPTSTEKNKLLEEDLYYKESSSVVEIIHEKTFYPGDFFEFEIITDSAVEEKSEPKIPKPEAEINGAGSSEINQFFPFRGKIIRILTIPTLLCIAALIPSSISC